MVVVIIVSVLAACGGQSMLASPKGDTFASSSEYCLLSIIPIPLTPLDGAI